MITRPLKKGVFRLNDNHKSRPAHEDLDVDVKSAGKSLLHDKNGFKKARKSPKKTYPENLGPVKRFTDKPVSIKAVELSSLEGEKQPPISRIPNKSPYVNVGMSKDKLWFEDSSTVAGDNVPPPDLPVNDEDDEDSFSFERLNNMQGFNPLDPKAQTFSSYDSSQEDPRYNEEEQAYEETQPYEETEPYEEEVEYSEYSKEEEPYKERSYDESFMEKDQDYESLVDSVYSVEGLVKPEEYILYIDGKPLETEDGFMISYDKDYIRSVIQELIINQDIDFERIMVFKRLKLDYGVVF